MTLRTRLLLTCAVILGVVAGGSFLILQAQRTFLVGQVDDQLRAARPLIPLSPLQTDRGVERPPRPLAPDDAPISALYLGVVQDGALATILQGQLLADVPDIDVGELEGGDPPSEPFTVDGTSTDSRFRVVAAPGPEPAATAVIALPLDEVDGSIDRLERALAGVAAAIAAVLLLAMWSVQRLGLRPIASVTSAADAIARGDRERRAFAADPRTEAGRLATAFNVMLDERDATEERLRQFVADASHELRTPLTSIRGYLDLYQEGGFREEGELDDVIRRMHQESARMNELVEDLLLLAQLDQHRPLRREHVDIRRLLDDAAADARVVQPERPINLDTTSERPIEIVGDAFRLQQVIGILVHNALVHTEPTARLHLTGTATTTGVRIEVADEGPGVAPEVASRVFDRFYRGDRSRGRRTGGSGLGLAIARSIVEAHGGTITLASEPTRGSRFTVELPATPPTPEAVTVAAESHTRPASDGSPPRVADTEL